MVRLHLFAVLFSMVAVAGCGGALFDAPDVLVPEDRFDDYVIGQDGKVVDRVRSGDGLGDDPEPNDDTPPVVDDQPSDENPPPGGGGQPQGEERPASVLSTGFFVKDGEIYDPNGERFIVKGINHTHWWGDQNNNLRAIDEIRKTGSNAVRVVFGPDMGADTPAERREVVERYIANKMVPIVEDHAGTCGEDPAQLAAMTDTWLLPENVAWLKQHEKHVILNIANEWGPDDADVWANAYITSIQRIRAAGINNMIVVDGGGGCAQDPRTIEARGLDVLNADPQKNVAFSIHMYAFWRTDEADDIGAWGFGGAPWSIKQKMGQLKRLGLALMVGEIAWDGIDIVEYNSRQALIDLNDLGIGWLAWSWNQNSIDTYDLRKKDDPESAPASGWRYNSASDLTEGGELFILDPQLGIESTAIPSSAF